MASGRCGRCAYVEGGAYPLDFARRFLEEAVVVAVDTCEDAAEDDGWSAPPGGALRLEGLAVRDGGFAKAASGGAGAVGAVAGGGREQQSWAPSRTSWLLPAVHEVSQFEPALEARRWRGSLGIHISRSKQRGRLQLLVCR